MYNEEIKQNVFYLFPDSEYLHVRTVIDVYYVSHSVSTCLSISSLLAKEPRPDTMTETEIFLLKKIDYFTSKKATNSFFLYFCQFLLKFFLLVCSKDDKALESNKLKSLVKSILFFCKKFFFASYILQSTRLARGSKTFIDNIFLNSIKFNTFSGNLT